MDKTFQQLAKELLAELRAINAKLDSLHTDLSRLPDTLNQKQIDAIREYAEANKKSGNVPMPISTPIPIGVEAETRERKDVAYWLFKGIEILGIAAVVAYAAITYNMWKEMIGSTDATYQAAKQSRISAEAANRAANAAKISAEIAELSQRPWIKITGIKAIGNEVIPALNFSGYGHGAFPHGRKQIDIHFEIPLINIGHSVAEVFVDSELFLPMWESQGPTSHGYSLGYSGEVAKEKNRYCGMSSQKTDFPVKFVVFPNEPFTWGGGVSQPILPDRINRIKDVGDVVLPVIIVCANYRLPGSAKIYQSSVLYEAFRADNRSRFIPEGRDFTSAKLLLIRNESQDEAH